MSVIIKVHKSVTLIFGLFKTKTKSDLECIIIMRVAKATQTTEYSVTDIVKIPVQTLR